MNKNYNTIKLQLRKYSFEFLKVSNEPLIMLDRLNDKHPQMIIDAQKPNLLAAAIAYLYLKRNNLNGRGGITAKAVGEYFGVKASAISAKTFDVEFWLYGMNGGLDNNEVYEFIDKDRFKVNEIYWEFIESEEAEDVEKSIIILKKIIKKDPDYFDPYITLHEYYLEKKETQKAFEILAVGFQRAMELVELNEKFPDELPWGFMENRHIIRVLFSFATFLWMGEDKKVALALLLQLLKSNTRDNIGARYSIVAILEGYESIEHLEEQFVTEGGYMDAIAINEWFNEKVEKHRDVMGWWLDLEEDE